MKKNFVWTRIKDLFGIIRFKIAYFIAPDWIDDLEHRLSVFLCEQTGGRLSKCYYSIETMRIEANDYQQRVCDECEYYLADNEQSEDVTDINVGNKSEWISVDERLPTETENDRGLVGIVNGYNGKIHFRNAIVLVDYDFSEKEWWSEDYDLTGCEVVYWMPLPKAPNMKGGAE
jgi:hypothetical protein